MCSSDVEGYMLDIKLLQRLKESRPSLYKKLFLSVSRAVRNDLISMNEISPRPAMSEKEQVSNGDRNRKR